MNFDRINEELFSFLDHSPNAFFAVRNMCDILQRAGMIRLYEGTHKLAGEFGNLEKCYAGIDTTVVEYLLYYAVVFVNHRDDPADIATLFYLGSK